ncbi:hypothetical protein [Streptomyces sp. NBC_01727]|uniref:hypothetical protein n=1 Tax=unclassified Streptomyces TaxID=2593676 RepID=UPI002E11698A|nr:hypothetical protein OIE76_03520 [Streptomyces sp. NBC_01727]
MEQHKVLPQTAHHGDEGRNERRTPPFGVEGAGPGLYTADQAAVVATALVSQIYAAAAATVALAEHLLVTPTGHQAEDPGSPHRCRGRHIETG